LGARADRIRVTRFLRDFDRFVNNAFLFIVVTNFHVTAERIIFGERKTIGTVIGWNTSWVWMIVRMDTGRIPSFTFHSSRTIENRGCGRKGCDFAYWNFDTRSGIVFHAWGIVNNFEATQRGGRLQGGGTRASLVAASIDSSDIGNGMVRSIGVVTREINGLI
jgi:hypothetical protein